MKKDFQFTTTGQFLPEKKTECILVKSENWNTIKSKLAGINLKRYLFVKLGFLLMGIGSPIILQCFIIKAKPFWMWIAIGIFISLSGLIFIVLGRNKDKENSLSIDHVIDLLAVIEQNSGKAILGENLDNISGQSFSFDQSVNYKSLQEFMDYLIPENPRSAIKNKKYLSEIIKRRGENYHSLYKYYQQTKNYINDIQANAVFCGNKLFQHQIIESAIRLSVNVDLPISKDLFTPNDLHILRLITKIKQENQSKALEGPAEARPLK